MNKNLIISTSLILFNAIILLSCEPEVRDTDNISSLPSQTITLENFEGFRDLEAKNWQIAGNIYADRNSQHHLETEPGMGIIANLPDEQNRQDLYTDFEHGDIDFEANFVMPKGSNSGIYFQGRYEVQLFDSWGKKEVSFSDCGAIYQRWDEQSKKGYEGYPPLINASRAPGLWQHIKVRFQAPRFDENGKKIANARFLEVYLNGSLVQENVEVSGPTRSAFFDDEAPKGPLVIQGDHGPVALRNIRYKTYGQDKIRLADLSYALFQGEYDSFDTLSQLEPDKTGKSDSLSYQAAGDFDRFAIRFDGQLSAPKEGKYLFDLSAHGPARLVINGDTVADNRLAQDMDEHAFGSLVLKEGNHDFSLIFLKNNRPWRRGLSLAYEGPEIPKTRLHAASSVPTPQQPEPMVVDAENAVAMQRGFFNHKGKKYTHTITVGTPMQINFAHDLSSGAILSGWRGDFLDATDMWHQRGEAQLAKPLGSAVDFTARPLIVQLSNEDDPWPDSLDMENGPFQYRGFELKEDGMPSFLYRMDHVAIEDFIHADSSQHSISRELTFDSAEPYSQMYCLLAEGETIELLPDGSYAIDDKSYYLQPVRNGNGQPLIRNDRGKQQLILPLIASENPLKIKYDIIW